MVIIWVRGLQPGTKEIMAVLDRHNSMGNGWNQVEWGPVNGNMSKQDVLVHQFTSSIDMDYDVIW